MTLFETVSNVMWICMGHKFYTKSFIKMIVFLNVKTFLSLYVKQ